jgi:hypothetical protein
MNASAPQILVLKGVRLSDLTNTCPRASTTVTQSKLYSCLPEEFTGVTTWVKYTNLKCWHCGRTFKEYPKFIPTNPKKTPLGKFTCGVMGVFHTWNCASAYVADYTSERTNRETQRLLCMVEAMFTGKSRSFIPPAPPRIKLREYSGYSGLTPAEYDELITKTDTIGTVYLNQPT